MLNMMRINLTLLLFVLFYTVTAHRGGRGHGGWDNSGRGRSSAKSSRSNEENCRETLKNQPPELPMFGTVGKGTSFEDWGWDEWTNSCSRGLGGYGPITWDDDDNDLDDDFEVSSGLRGKTKKNTHHGHRSRGRKGGSSGRMSSTESGNFGPWSPGREYLPDRSLNAEKAIAMVRNSLSNLNGNWTQLVESAAKECATKTAAQVGEGRDHHDRGCGGCGGGSSSEEMDFDVGTGEVIGGFKGKKSPQPNKKAPANQKSQAGKTQNGNKAGQKKPAQQKKVEQKKTTGKQGN
ncbi:hypothetical protein B566_EDAN009470, partial [Ephemera danica]